ncbi:hypothetical protein Tco_0161495 [Tanacetum coccineum]
MRSTGIKHYIDPISACKIWRTNRKCCMPIDLYPCKVEESMTMKKVGDQIIGVIRRRRIDKEGNVSRFQEYHTSDEEEEEPSEHPPYNKYGFVDHLQLQIEDQRNKFAPYPLPPQEGNMNGWLTDDANDSDLESSATAILTVGILTDEAVRSGTLAKAGEKRKERDEASKSKSVRKDEKKAKGRRGFVAVVPPRKGKENRLQILQSIDQGPFELGTTRDALGTTLEGGVLLGPERPRLPKDIYKLINHNIKAKAIWDNVKMLLVGSELTKEDRESQLYDEFERFKMLPGENINEYYVRFHKLVNDMRNIRMIMPNIQLNSKFVNNMSPEWDRFVTAVKLNKGLKKTNHEQLYAYLKQHEKHAGQDRLIIKRITIAMNDQLAFVSTVQPHSQSSHVQSHQYPSSSKNPQSPRYPQFPETSQIDSGYTQTDEILDNLTKQMALLA